MLLLQSYLCPNYLEGDDSVDGQMRGHKEYPFSGVTSYNRVRNISGMSVCGRVHNFSNITIYGSF